MLQVAMSMAADGDREGSLSRQAARLYILARHEHIISSAQPCDVFQMQKVIGVCKEMILSLGCTVYLYIRSKDRGSADILAPAKINAMGKFASGHGV